VFPASDEVPEAELVGFRALTTADQFRLREDIRDTLELL